MGKKKRVDYNLVGYYPLLSSNQHRILSLFLSRVFFYLIQTIWQNIYSICSTVLKMASCVEKLLVKG